MDTRYLLQRGETWYIRIPHPPKEWGCKGAFVKSLDTANPKKARALRDKYVLPLLAEASVPGMLSAIARGLAAHADATERGLAALYKQLPSARAELTVGEAVAAFTAYLQRAGNYAPGTVEDYKGALGGIVQIFGAGMLLTAIAPADVARVRDTLLALPVQWRHRAHDPLTPAVEGERTVSPATVGKHLMYARRLYRWCQDEGRIPAGPDPFAKVNVVKTRQAHKRPPDASEIDRLMALPCPDGFDRLTWESLPTFARYTACRIGELAALEAEDVVTVQGVRCIRISERGGRRLKTSASERTIPVADRLAATLNKVLAAHPSGRLFDAGDYMDDAGGVIRRAKTFVKLWGRRAKAVAPDLSIHGLRVYGNSCMASAGVDLLDREALLGHRSERVQMAYTALDMGRLKKAVDTIP